MELKLGTPGIAKARRSDSCERVPRTAKIRSPDSCEANLPEREISEETGPSPTPPKKREAKLHKLHQTAGIGTPAPTSPEFSEWFAPKPSGGRASRYVLPEIRPPRPHASRSKTGKRNAWNCGNRNARSGNARRWPALQACPSGGSLAGRLGAPLRELKLSLQRKIALGTLAASRFGLGRARSLPQKFFPKALT